MTDEEFARALAPMLEVVQRGVLRPAAPADVLEILGVGGRRYVLKGADGRYIAGDGSGWTRRQRRAAVLDDVEEARAAKRIGVQRYGVRVKVVRIRRKGTCGLEAVRMRPDLAPKVVGDRIELAANEADIMHLLAVLTGAKGDGGVQ